MKPVGFGDFLNDERVQDIIGGKEGVKGGIDYEHPEDRAPVFSIGGVKLENNAVTTSLSGSILIEVDNIDDFDGYLVEWFRFDEGQDQYISLGRRNSLQVSSTSPAIAPFNEVGIYHIAVTGIERESKIPYSSVIFIRIDN